MKVAIEQALLKEASTGCQSDELRELITVIDTSSDPDVPAPASSLEVRWVNSHAGVVMRNTLSFRTDFVEFAEFWQR